MELELLKRFEAVQMEIELHICSFQNPFSLFFLYLTECLRIPFLFTLTASFIREKTMPIFFSKHFLLDNIWNSLLCSLYKCYTWPEEELPPSILP